MNQQIRATRLVICELIFHDYCKGRKTATNFMYIYVNCKEKKLFVNALTSIKSLICVTLALKINYATVDVKLGTIERVYNGKS